MTSTVQSRFKRSKPVQVAESSGSSVDASENPKAKLQAQPRWPKGGRFKRLGLKQSVSVSQALSKLFLPDGYPQSVTSDYTQYQVYNCLQAFCSSVAGLIASRAILEGAGVGDASASATNALLVTILQDACSRLTTIIGGYYLGKSLFAEAKMYRFVGDMLNDAAITLDALSPVLNSLGLPSARVGVLCLSGGLRSLCGIAAGGSKAALAAHFCSPSRGDLGELNAKDSSRETVISLLGMLVGTVMIPYLTSWWRTYTVLFALLGMHLVANYVGVRCVVLRSLNWQRTGIAWDGYRRSGGVAVPSPGEVARLERVLEKPGVLWDEGRRRAVGRCVVGVGESGTEGHALWVEGRSVYVAFQEGYGKEEEMAGWVAAMEAGIGSEAVSSEFGVFLWLMREKGWEC